MNVENLHKLVTREDPIHLHKALGLACLFNFVYRLFLLFSQGTMFLDTPSGIVSVGLHGLLSVSSLIFHIPQNRVNGKPMIYPEMRAHTIVFTLRSVLSCFSYYYGFSQFTRMCIIFLTMISADSVTLFYNQDNANGTTIRNMPYDKRVTEETKNSVKLMNSNMQIGATLFMLGNIESAFLPMLAIQIAALLSTLVRKSIISANMWHIIYAMSLWVNIVLYYNSLPINYIIIQVVCYNLYKRIFFPNRTNKYFNWFIICGLFALYNHIQFYPFNEFGHYIRLPLIFYFLVDQIQKTKGLFFLESYTNN
jgi:hypothetical protein